MARRYDDVVDVRARQGTPHSFVWGGRSYLVMNVVSTWYVRHAWWREEGARALDSLRVESRLWRVEARAGQSCHVGLFDLVEGEPWRLVRAWD